MAAEFCGVKGARERMGVPYRRIKPPAGKRKLPAFGFSLKPKPSATPQPCGESKLRQPQGQRPAIVIPPAPCPERDCGGIGVDVGPRGHCERLLRCERCGCEFRADDVPAHLVDAIAAEIFQANLVAKEASNGTGISRGDESVVETQRHRRLDGSARYVYRMDRRRRGSNQAPV